MCLPYYICIQFNFNESKFFIVDVNVLRKSIYEWLKLNAIGKVIYNDSLGAYIKINKSGIKHSISFSNKYYVQKLKSMYQIEDLVKRAIYSRSIPGKRNRKTNKEIIILANNVYIESIYFNVEIVIRHTNEGRFYYNHMLIKK